MRPLIICREGQVLCNIPLQARLKAVRACMVESPPIIDGGVICKGAFSGDRIDSIQCCIGEGMRHARSEVGYLEDRLSGDLLLDGKSPFIHCCVSAVNWGTGRTRATARRSLTWGDRIAKTRYLSLRQGVLLGSKVGDRSAQTAELSEAIVDAKSCTEYRLAMECLRRP